MFPEILATVTEHRKNDMQTSTPTALLEWSLYVDCPKCDASNDLADSHHDVDHDISRRIFSNQWDKLDDWEITCEKCGHEFKIEKVEY
jgi:Zn finger protein HypA/HybF involved in hydrogenase expression